MTRAIGLKDKFKIWLHQHYSLTVTKYSKLPHERKLEIQARYKADGHEKQQ